MNFSELPQETQDSINATIRLGATGGCETCKLCLSVEEGYSNWTVEGATAYCIKDLNPCMPVDGWFGEAPELKYGLICPQWSKGEPVVLDVEREDLDAMPEEFKDYAKKNNIK